MKLRLPPQDQVLETARAVWPAAAILVAYVTLMGVPSQAELREIRQETRGLESNDEQLGGVRDRLAAAQARLDEVVRREELFESGKEGRRKAGQRNLRDLGQRLEHHGLLLIEEGPLPGDPKVWNLELEGAYSAVQCFIDELEAQTTVTTTDLRMNGAVAGEPRWALRLIAGGGTNSGDD